MPKLPAHRVRRKPGFFHPVPLRPRQDGWTAARQCAFLAQLYLTGSVAAAARMVGMGRESAHRLRARPGAEGFAAQWDRVLAPPGSGHVGTQSRARRKATLDGLRRAVDSGLVAPVIHRGRVVAIRRKADNSALLQLVRRADSMAARGAGEERQT